jgi:hypothetical protein
MATSFKTWKGRGICDQREAACRQRRSTLSGIALTSKPSLPALAYRRAYAGAAVRLHSRARCSNGAPG